MADLFTAHTLRDAWQLFLQHWNPAVTREKIRAADALGRVLAETVNAPHDLPEFRRSTVDGYAVRAQDTFGASASLPAYFTVAGETANGKEATSELAPNACTLIHTGGMLPTNADAVVMVENTEIIRANPSRSETFPLEIEVFRPVAPGENVIQVGEDVRAGEIILPAGHRLRAADLGGLLALGTTSVQVARCPRVAILSQGDEVIAPENRPTAGQVRDINSYTLAALTEKAGGTAWQLGIAADDYDALAERARDGFEAADMLVISAGSSVSAHDMTASVIKALGAPGILVHGLNVRPGKPTIVAVCNGKPVFGLPGNPVSAMVIFELVVAPAIHRLLGLEVARVPARTLTARLTRALPSTTGREDFVPVRLTQDGENWHAVPVFGKSNLIFTLIKADGFVHVPLDRNGLAEGEFVIVTLYE